MTRAAEIWAAELGRGSLNLWTIARLRGATKLSIRNLSVPARLESSRPGFVFDTRPASRMLNAENLGNHLLASLPSHVPGLLKPHLEPVSLPQGLVLLEAEDPIERLYFPETGMLSLLIVARGGRNGRDIHRWT